MRAYGSVYTEANRLLKPHRRQGATLTAIWCIVLMLMVAGAAVLQSRLFSPYKANGAISPYDGILLPVVISMAAVMIPLRNHTDRWLGTVTGVLTECDRGFLDCSSSIWLWYRRVCVNLFADVMLMLSFVPTILLYCLAVLCLQYGASQSEGTVALMAALHCIIGSILLLLLPLRVWCSMAALSLCYLKQPHRSAFTIWRYALRCTRQISGTLLWNRLKSLPLLLLPFYGYIALPGLMASEMLLCDRVRRQILPEL